MVGASNLHASLPVAIITDPLVIQPVADIFEAEKAVLSGEYEKAVEMVDKAIEEQVFLSERWFNAKLKSQLALGRYDDALATLRTALERYDTEIEIRRIGIDVFRFNGMDSAADLLSKEIDALYRRNSWRYRDADELVTAGRNQLANGADAKTVLTKFYDRAKEDSPNSPLPYLAIGELALEKHDYTLAIKNFRKAVALDAQNADAFLGLAKALHESDTAAANTAIQTALELNPRHVPSLNYQIDFLINAEEYDKARLLISRVHEINSNDPVAWSYRAVLAHLENEPEKEAAARSAALKCWKRNPHVDYLIGKKLSQKYRFKESARYQRRALLYDADYLPAKIQLAHDLLRTGQELEGWRLADQVFDEDQYSVVAHNLVTLRDQLSEFATIEHDGFIVRMSKREASIYGEYVRQLLSEAKRVLVEKYEVELETPIFIEIFPEQQDFAIRTFGLPGGQGFLGVCFGRLITMNSPAAQGARKTNWQSVLWHEFCHVVTLQKTNNRMPRWLSEGISVYEERLRNPAWGQSMNPAYRKMLVSESLLPISELSSAFLKARTPKDVDFAYFESSLAVEFLFDEFGNASVLQLLDQLGLGIPINDALRRTTAPLDVLDRKFRKYVDAKVASFSPKVNWAEAADEKRELDLATLKSLLEQQKFDVAVTAAERLQETYEDNETRALCQTIMASCYRAMEQPDKELGALKAVLAADANNVNACLRGMSLAESIGDVEHQKLFAIELIRVNPLVRRPHEVLARIAIDNGQDELMTRSLSAVLELEPVDIAEVHFQLAGALFRKSELAQARRHVLLALVQAPRYRAAHQLLLDIEKQAGQRQIDAKVPAEQNSSAQSAQPSEKSEQVPVESEKNADTGKSSSEIFKERKNEK